MHCIPFIQVITSPNHRCTSEYPTKNLLHIAFLYCIHVLWSQANLFFCIANSSVRCMSQIMKLCRVLLSNRRIKKHQNLNTNSGFFEAMHFAVKFHYIYFVIFHYLLPKNCGALVVITLFNIYISSNEGKKLLYVPYGSRLMFLSHKCFIAFSYL